MTIKEFFSLKSNRYFWGNLIAMLLVVVIAIFATMKGLDSYTLHGEAIEVPNAKGMSVEEVLDYATGKSQLYDTLREGIVFRSLDGKQSFKAVSPEFLIKHNE